MLGMWLCLGFVGNFKGFRDFRGLDYYLIVGDLIIPLV
jgi:hypothetical protein